MTFSRKFDSDFKLNSGMVSGGTVSFLAFNLKRIAVFGISVDRGLTNLDLNELVRKLGIKNFRGVYMRDTLHNTPTSSGMWYRKCEYIERRRKSLGFLVQRREEKNIF